MKTKEEIIKAILNEFSYEWSCESLYKLSYEWRKTNKKMDEIPSAYELAEWIAKKRNLIDT